MITPDAADPRNGLPPVLAVGNQKGGVGKTTTTLGLASAARAVGARVLVLDLDPQGNATDVLRPATDSPGSYGLLADPRQGGGVPLAEAFVPSGWSGVDLVPSTPALANVDVDIAPTQPLRLRRALSGGTQTLTGYDVVLIDCPPGLGRLLIAALVAATDLLVVTEPATHALQGVTRIEETAQEARTGFEQETPHLVGIMVNRTRRTVEHARSEADLRAEYGELVLVPAVPERIAVTDAAARGIPIHESTGEGALAVAGAMSHVWSELRPQLHPLGATSSTAPAAATIPTSTMSA